MTEPFRFALEADADTAAPWVEVREGGLDQPLWVKFKVAGTSLRIVGMRLDSGREITSGSLRAVRLGQLATELHTFLRSELQDASSHLEVELSRLRGVKLTSSQAPLEYLSADEQDLLALAEIDTFREALQTWLADSNSSPEFDRRTRGAKPPTDTEYRQFALLHLEELEQGHRGAKQRTAKRAGMDRGTAYRWIRECQERGLLPREES